MRVLYRMPWPSPGSYLATPSPTSLGERVYKGYRLALRRYPFAKGSVACNRGRQKKAVAGEISRWTKLSLTTVVVFRRMQDMTEEKPGLGDQELALLRFVTDRAPVTVRAAVAEFGEARGLARTTILTVMERLRTKGYLRRQKSAEGAGAWEYLPEQGRDDLMRGLVREFIEKSLGGSVSPMVAYLSDAKNLSEKEKADLRAIVAGLEE